MQRFGMKDEHWDQLKNLLPGRPGYVGAIAHDNRKFVEAVIYRYRTGIPWRDLPARFGNWNNIHRRHQRWSERGIWESIFTILSVDRDNEYAMIDATIVRAHQHSSGAQKKMAPRI